MLNVLDRPVPQTAPGSLQNGPTTPTWPTRLDIVIAVSGTGTTAVMLDWPPLMDGWIAYFGMDVADAAISGWPRVGGVYRCTLTRQTSGTGENEEMSFTVVQSVTLLNARWQVP